MKFPWTYQPPPKYCKRHGCLLVECEHFVHYAKFDTETGEGWEIKKKVLECPRYHNMGQNECYEEPYMLGSPYKVKAEPKCPK